MSRAFVKCQNPPLHKDWKVWTKNSSATIEEINCIKTFVQIVGEVLENDTINRIVYFIFENRYVSFDSKTPDLWGNDLFKWMDYWCGNPIEHVLNPLYVVKNSFELCNPTYIKKLGYEQCCIVINKPVENIRNILINLGVGVSNMCLGITFPKYDVSNIKKCNIMADDLVLRSSYVFDDNCVITKNVSGCEYPSKFYYDPKFRLIPSSILSFTIFRFVLELFDETIKPKVISMLCVFSSNKTPNVTEYHINEDDPHHHMIIKNGMLAYKY